MKPKRIIIVRHGQSQFNADRSVRSTIPDFQLEVTNEGMEQAWQLGQELAENWVGTDSYGFWHSPFKRSLQTTIALNKRLPYPKFVREDPRIREQDWGHLRSQDEAERIDKERDAYSRFWYRIPDGESGADVFDRVSTFLETLHRDFQKPDHPEVLIISTHGYTARVIVMRWLHITVKEFEKMPNPPNCGYYVLELQANDRYKLVRDPWS